MGRGRVKRREIRRQEKGMGGGVGSEREEAMNKGNDAQAMGDPHGPDAGNSNAPTEITEDLSRHKVKKVQSKRKSRL